MNNKNQEVSYTLALHNASKISKLSSCGYEFVHETSRIKVGLGAVCIIISILPNGLFPIFFPIGISLLLSGGIDLNKITEQYKRKWRLFKCKF